MVHHRVHAQLHHEPAPGLVSDGRGHRHAEVIEGAQVGRGQHPLGGADLGSPGDVDHRVPPAAAQHARGHDPPTVQHALDQDPQAPAGPAGRGLHRPLHKQWLADPRHRTLAAGRQGIAWHHTPNTPPQRAEARLQEAVTPASQGDLEARRIDLHCGHGEATFLEMALTGQLVATQLGERHGITHGQPGHVVEDEPVVLGVGLGGETIVQRGDRDVGHGDPGPGLRGHATRAPTEQPIPEDHADALGTQAEGRAPDGPILGRQAGAIIVGAHEHADPALGLRGQHNTSRGQCILDN